MEKMFKVQGLFSYSQKYQAVFQKKEANNMLLLTELEVHTRSYLF